MRTRRRLLPVLAVLGAGALTVPVLGCGADDLNPEAVAEAAETTAAADSMRFRYAMDVDGDQIGGEGIAETDPVRLAMTMELPPLGELDVVMDEASMYMEVPEGTGEVFGTGDAGWMRIDLEAAGGLGLDAATSGQLGSTDPLEQLEMLKAMADIEEVGTEEIDGVQTTHYEGDLDLRETVQFAAPDQRDDLERQIDAIADLNDGETTIPTEVWIDDDALVRRMTQSYVGELAGDVTMEFFDFGVEGEEIEVPSGDDVVDVTDEIGSLTSP